MTAQPADTEDLRSTPLAQLHLAHNARMVPFAGYQMPVNYKPGIIKEHQHCRQHAGLFDVSHMGQIRVEGEAIVRHLETQIPVDLLGLGEGRQKYGLLLNRDGGVVDDLMIMNTGGHWTLVVNAACKDNDLELLSQSLGNQLDFSLLEDRALLALQGPDAEQALQPLTDKPLADMVFMDVAGFDIDGIPCLVSRSGYTGEDGFEISVPASRASDLAETLLDHPSVALVGLGARDSLRMEAGLCLYGQDMDASISPLEVGLKWAISPARRTRGERPGGFPGDKVILDQLDNGAATTLTGLLPEGRAPMRTGTPLFDETSNEIGVVTSGGFSPSLGKPISLARINRSHSDPGTGVFGEVRGKKLPAEITSLPFVPHNYVR